MSRGMKAALCVTLAAALIVMGVLGAGILRDRKRLREMETELAASRAAWQDTAERKEKLQAELKETEEALKEAKLTLEESTQRAEELRADIAALETEIAQMKTGGE